MCNLDLPCEILNNWFRLKVRLNTCDKRLLALLCPSVIRVEQHSTNPVPRDFAGAGPENFGNHG